MKTLVSSAFALMLSFSLCAQPTQVEKIFKKHDSKPGYSTAHITNYMFSLFIRLADEEAEENLKDITQNLTGVKLLTVDSVLEPLKAKTFRDDMMATLTEANYTTMMTIDNDGNEIKLLIYGTTGMINELVMVGDMYMAVLLGEIDMQTIVTLGENIYIEGFDPTVPDD